MIVVADIGGTRMRIGCADDDGTLSGVVIFDTPQVYVRYQSVSPDTFRPMTH